MDDEALKMSIRKFLKTVGVNSQLAIEKAAREAVASDQIQDKVLPARMTLVVDGLSLNVEFDGEIHLG